MNCLEIENRLNDYLDGILSSSENQEIAKHLESCLACREELLRLRNLMAETAMLPKEMKPAHDLWSEIAGRIASTKQAASTSFFGLPLDRTVGTLAIAALVLIVAGGIFWKAKQSSKPFWEFGRLSGNPKVASARLFNTGKFRVGEWLETDDSSRAVISVGTIGHVQVEPNSRIRLVEARLTEHRLALQKGALEVQISAPPRLFFVETPSAVAVDMGCAYRLTVDETGAGQLEVTFGWVALVRDGRESMVPTGAICLIRPAVGPGTPFFKNKSSRFQRALEKLDFENGGLPELEIVLNESQKSDASTLWHLLTRVSGTGRELLYSRTVELTPPPEGITREGILRLDAKMLLRWKEEIDLKTEFFSEPQTKITLTERSNL